jgi:Anti-sigma factor NepR
MSDESKKPANAPEATAGKPQVFDASAQGEAVPEDVVTPVDGEIDLARLAPQLRGLYQELLNEPIPDRFTKLLDELARKETDKQ